MKILYYKDKKKEWRWKMQAKNNKILADSAEGYKRRPACEKAAMKIIGDIQAGDIEEVYDY